MKGKIDRREVWAASIEDRPGGLAEKLESLAEAGVNLEFLVARRSSERKGEGVVFVTPVKGTKQTKAAKQAGFQKSQTLQSIRIEGPDRAGIVGKLTRALADAGINLRGVSSAAFGRRFVTYLALDNSSDATRAISLLKKLR